MASSMSVEQADKILDDQALAEEDLLAELDAEDIPSHIREARFAAMKKQTQQYEEMKQSQHGLYTEIIEEKGFLDVTTAEERCIVHFYHADFRRCSIMDTHLKVLSEKHFETKFAKINVDKAKFFVTKLKIVILPALICFKKGIVVDRIIGFDELGNTDDFQTSALETRLASSGVIHGDSQKSSAKNSGSIFGRSVRSKTEDDDSDNDW